MRSAPVCAALLLGLCLSSLRVEAEAPPVAPSPAASGPVAAAEATCDINLDSWVGTRSDLTYVAPFYESTVTVAVRVAPETCTWRIDSAGKPSWISASVVAGAYAGHGYHRGPGVVDIRIKKNSGYARSGRFHFATSSYAIPVDITQRGYTGTCVFKPGGTSGTPAQAVEQGFISIARTMAAGPNNFAAQIVDTSSCPLSPRPSAFTFGMTGATITAVGGHPRTYDLRRAGVAANLEGEGALFVLNEPSYAHFSGVLGLELPDLSALPANLRITREKLKKYFVSFGDGGGTIAITGKVTRPKADPSRPCAFLPEYYRVIGSTSAGNWLSVQPESGCSPGKPDSGTLVIGALPARSGQPRVGAIFTAWGAVVFVVENGG